MAVHAGARRRRGLVDDECDGRAVRVPRRVLLRRRLHAVAEAAQQPEHRRRRPGRQLRGAGRRGGGRPGARALHGWLLALVLFLWTPPHFWSLAIASRADYAAAGVPMLPVVVGAERAARIVFLSTVALVRGVAAAACLRRRAGSTSSARSAADSTSAQVVARSPPRRAAQPRCVRSSPRWCSSACCSSPPASMERRAGAHEFLSRPSPWLPGHEPMSAATIAPQTAGPARCVARAPCAWARAIAVSCSLLAAAAAPAHGQAPAQRHDAALNADAAVRASQAAVGRRIGDTSCSIAKARPVRLSSYRGKPLLVSFIYTGCFQVCPTGTRALDEAVRALRGALRHGRFNVVSIGFNQPADSPAGDEGLRRAEPHRPAATGSSSARRRATSSALTRDFGFSFQATPAGFDHVLQVTLVDAEGRIVRQVYGDRRSPADALGEPLTLLLAGAAAAAAVGPRRADRSRADPLHGLRPEDRAPTGSTTAWRSRSQAG